MLRSQTARTLDKMSEDFLQALEKKTLLMVLLKNEDWEKQFRSSLRVKEPNVVNYLSQDEVLADMIQALVNEEGMRQCYVASSHPDRTLQEASEVLGIILFNVDAINTALVNSHLEGLFRYLQRWVALSFTIA